jgi:hypothetical protein
LSGVGATLKLGRKTSLEHRVVIYQTNLKRMLYNNGHFFGVLDLYKLISNIGKIKVTYVALL